MAGLKGVHLPGQGVEDVGPQAGLFGVGHHRAPAHQALAGDEIHPHVVFEHPDVGVGQDLLRQDALHFGPGHVLGVNHPPVGMAAFPAQIIAVVLAEVEMGPQVDQLPDARRTLADHQLDDVRVGQAFPGGEGVLECGIQTGHPAPGPRRCRPGPCWWRSPSGPFWLSG